MRVAPRYPRPFSARHGGGLEASEWCRLADVRKLFACVTSSLYNDDVTKAGASGGNLASLPLRVGELLQQALQGRYEFVEFLGQGASSLVFRVRNLALGRFEALKVLFRESAEQVARFRQEAQLVASLHHPHIATVYAFGEDAGFL
jgi:hypothetical protein